MLDSWFYGDVCFFLMRISVVIPCFNAAPFLARAIDSVRRQEVPAEIIVVDDASTDDTLAVAERLKGQDPHFQVIHRNLNEGPGRARNVGLRHTRTDYVCFLDADDAYGDGVFHAAIPLLDADPLLDAVRFRVKIVNCHRDLNPRWVLGKEGQSACNVIM
jgi:glycosyltransferase involved in cell wall biosynthesis